MRVPNCGRSDRSANSTSPPVTCTRRTFTTGAVALSVGIGADATAGVGAGSVARVGAGALALEVGTLPTCERFNVPSSAMMNLPRG